MSTANRNPALLLRCCFITAHGGEYDDVSLLALGAARIFPKPFHLDDLVQKARLVDDSPWLGLYDAALPQDPHPLMTQPSARCAEIARARS